MSIVVKKREITEQGQLQALVIEHVAGIEPGLTVLDSRLLLGQATIDVIAIDADGGLALMVVGSTADEEMLLKAVEAYSWCLEYPEAIHRLYPTTQISSSQPPRLLFVVERMPDSFHRKIKQLGFPEVDCVEFRHLEVDGAPAVYFDTLARLRRAPVATAPEPERVAVPPAPATNSRPTSVKLQKLLGGERPAAVREPAQVVSMMKRSTPRAETPRPAASGAKNHSAAARLVDDRVFTAPVALLQAPALEAERAPVEPVIAPVATPPLPAEPLTVVQRAIEPVSLQPLVAPVAFPQHVEPSSSVTSVTEPLAAAVVKLEPVVPAPAIVVALEPVVPAAATVVALEPIVPAAATVVELEPVVAAASDPVADVFTVIEPVVEPIALEAVVAELPAIDTVADVPAIATLAAVPGPEPIVQPIAMPVLELEVVSAPIAEPAEATREPEIAAAPLAQEPALTFETIESADLVLATAPEPADEVVSEPAVAEVAAAMIGAIEPVLLAEPLAAASAVPPVAVAPSVFARRGHEPALTVAQPPVSFADAAKDLLAVAAPSAPAQPHVVIERPSVEEITRAALDELVGATEKRATANERPTAFAKPASSFKRPRTIQPAAAVESPAVAATPKLGAAPQRLAATQAKPEPVAAPAPAAPSESSPAVTQGFEGLKFPNDGVLTRQWMEFLNQMAAGK